MKANRFERGQALIIIVLSIVAIFGFAALAVDMGRIYAERRRAQGAADAAALAAAYTAANTTSTTESAIRSEAKDAAMASALRNGYSIDSNDIHIPAEGSYEECNCEYIQVNIKSRISPIFAQFVYKGVEEITTNAVARGRRNTNITNEYYAIHALSTASDAFEVSGNTTLLVKGSGKADAYADIYSNGGGKKDGVSGVVTVSNGTIQIAIDSPAGWSCNGDDAKCKASVKPDPVFKSNSGKDFKALPILDVMVPSCPDADTSYKGVNYYVHPTGINVTGQTTLTLQRGIHCVDGDISVSGGATLKGDGVLLVMKTGGINVTGNSSVYLKRLNSVVDMNSHSYNGMLIYMPITNDNTITIAGSANSWISGTILAPKSLCEIGGNSTVDASGKQVAGKAYNTSIICNKVKFIGDSIVNIYYDKEQNFQMQPVVELIK